MAVWLSVRASVEVKGNNLKAFFRAMGVLSDEQCELKINILHGHYSLFIRRLIERNVYILKKQQQRGII